MAKHLYRFTIYCYRRWRELRSKILDSCRWDR